MTVTAICAAVFVLGAWCVARAVNADADRYARNHRKGRRP